MPASPAVQRCVAARVLRGAGADAPVASGSSLHLRESIDRTTAPYRSAARRLRGRFARDPVRLQRSLQELARREDARRGDAHRPSGPPASPLSNLVDGDSAERFAALVGQHLSGAVLYYADRQALISAAGRLGIGRFEANLIIAAVQHRAESERTQVRHRGTELSQGVGRWLPAVAVVLAVEATLSFVAWWALRG